jgi:hypothetical protein
MTLTEARELADEMGWKRHALKKPIMGSYHLIIRDLLGERWCTDLADVEQKLAAARKLAEVANPSGPPPLYPRAKAPALIIFAKD